MNLQAKGMALMLDEIINYVPSLQNQVEVTFYEYIQTCLLQKFVTVQIFI